MRRFVYVFQLQFEAFKSCQGAQEMVDWEPLVWKFVYVFPISVRNFVCSKTSGCLGNGGFTVGSAYLKHSITICCKLTWTDAKYRLYSNVLEPLRYDFILQYIFLDSLIFVFIKVFWTLNAFLGSFLQRPFLIPS